MTDTLTCCTDPRSGARLTVSSKRCIGVNSLHIQEGAVVDIVIEEGATVTINGKRWTQ